MLQIKKQNRGENHKCEFVVREMPSSVSIVSTFDKLFQNPINISNQGRNKSNCCVECLVSEMKKTKNKKNKQKRDEDTGRC
jgi:hypothetical protein